MSRASRDSIGLRSLRRMPSASHLEHLHALRLRSLYGQHPCYQKHSSQRIVQRSQSECQYRLFRQFDYGQSEPCMLRRRHRPAHRPTRLLILPSTPARTSTRGRRPAPCIALVTISWRRVRRSQEPVPLERVE
jgi:hypothetical protein